MSWIAEYVQRRVWSYQGEFGVRYSEGKKYFKRHSLGMQSRTRFVPRILVSWSEVRTAWLKSSPESNLRLT